MGNFLGKVFEFKDKKILCSKWWVWVIMIFMVSLIPSPTTLFSQKAKSPVVAAESIVAQSMHVIQITETDKQKILIQIEGLEVEIRKLQATLLQLKTSLEPPQE